MNHAKLKALTVLLPVLALAGTASHSPAQTTATPQTAAAGAASERRSAAPQVVTVVHRLSGIKVLRLLQRSGTVSALESMDETFNMTSEVHTNILAGLALDDGETIVVWLPEAEVEVDAWGPFAPAVPSPPRPLAPPSVSTPESMQLTAELEVMPDLMIIGRDGKQHSAQYIGLDGITGLSLLKISEKSLPRFSGTRETAIGIKQRIRLFSPEPGPERRASTSTVSVRIGETEGTIVSLKRGLAGEINRVRMNSAKLSKVNVGGIAINDAGQTVGIVAGIDGNEAVILPPAVIRAAAKRVLARKGSVPRPWLGVSGESLAFTPLAGIVQQGWEPNRAMSLLRNQTGILLTSITPGSPAEVAALRAGDVIVRVNDNEVKSADDFSLFLETAGESPVLFTFVRPNHPKPESVSVKLSEVLGPFRLKQPFWGPRAFAVNPLIREGIETMPLRSAAGGQANSSGGLLVIYVQPQTPAFSAGLRPTDVIEAINGQPIMKTAPAQFQVLTSTSYTLSIIRDKEKLVLTVDRPTP